MLHLMLVPTVLGCWAPADVLRAAAAPVSAGNCVVEVVAEDGKTMEFRFAVTGREHASDSLRKAERALPFPTKPFVFVRREKPPQEAGAHVVNWQLIRKGRVDDTDILLKPGDRVCVRPPPVNVGGMIVKGDSFWRRLWGAVFRTREGK